MLDFEQAHEALNKIEESLESQDYKEAKRLINAFLNTLEQIDQVIEKITKRGK